MSPSPNFGSSITLLGTGTCQLGSERVASSVLVEISQKSGQKRRILYDLGRGIADKIADLGLKNDNLEHVVFSHFHPDHISDLIPFLHAASWSRRDPRKKDLHIYGPKGVEVQVMRFLSLFGPDEITRAHFKVHIHQIETSHFSIDGLEFEFCDLPPANNHGLKFSCNGKIIALTGDSYFHDQEIAFLKNVDIAVIDAGHISPEEIVSICVQSQAREIICSHIYQPLDMEDLRRRAQQGGFKGTLTLGFDGMKVSLD